MTAPPPRSIPQPIAPIDSFSSDANSSNSSDGGPHRPPLFFVQDDNDDDHFSYPNDDLDENPPPQTQLQARNNNVIPIRQVSVLSVDIQPKNFRNRNKRNYNNNNNNNINYSNSSDDDNIDDDDIFLSDQDYQNYGNIDYPKSFSLSTLGLTNVQQLPVLDDFTFVVGGKEHHCNVFFASFISPVITRILQTDISANKYTIDIDDTQNYFENILKLSKGDIISVTQENVLFFLEIAKILGNEEMFEEFSSYEVALNEDNAIDQYLQRLQYKFDIKRHVEFISSNFSKMKFDSLVRLSPGQLAEVLSHKSFMIRDEESFFRILCDYIDVKGEDAKFLLGYVNLPCLDENSIDSFIGMINPDVLNGKIWSAICSRLKLDVSKKCLKIPKKRYIKQKVQQFRQEELEKNTLFNGIINHLKKKGNLKKMVKITASSFRDDNMYVLTDITKDGFWSSYNLPNSWIKFHFKSKMIKLDEYSLETANLPPGQGHLISWVLEASNDDQEWVTLDSQYDLALHEGLEAAHAFQCDKKKFFRYFRIKQCGLNDKGDDTMILKAVEFFGRVKSVPQNEL